MVCSRMRPFNACSPDGTGILSYRNKLEDPFPAGNFHAEHVDERPYQIIGVKKKASVARKTRDDHILNTDKYMDVLFLEESDQRGYFAKQYFIQVHSTCLSRDANFAYTK